MCGATLESHQERRATATDGADEWRCEPGHASLAAAAYWNAYVAALWALMPSLVMGRAVQPACAASRKVGERRDSEGSAARARDDECDDTASSACKE